MSQAVGVIRKALSGFYYVDDGDGEMVACRARGKFRHLGITPLVGDRVQFTRLPGHAGALDDILPRKNRFLRPAVANIDQLVLVVSGATPVTVPFLIDRVTALADSKEGCSCIICINKCDLDPGDFLFKIYTRAGFPTLRVSAATREGIGALSAAIAGKISAFTGNSGVGKSSLLNALAPSFSLQVGEISEKLGRGRHTTRHVELYRLGEDALVADTPGFSSFDAERMELLRKEDLAWAFREFRPYLGQCRFVGCSHRKELGCAIQERVAAGIIPASRHESYLRLYQQASERKDWERPEAKKK